MTTASLLVPPDAEDERHARVRLFGRLLASHGALFMLVAVLVAAVILRPHFFDELVLRNTTRMAAVLGVIVIGQILLLIVGCVDLSVAAVVGFAAVLVTEAGPPFPLGVPHRRGHRSGRGSRQRLACDAPPCSPVRRHVRDARPS